MTAKKSTTASPKITSSDMGESERKYQAEDGLRTLTRAAEIRRDGGLMKDIEACRQQKMRDLASIKVQNAPQTMKSGK